MPDGDQPVRASFHRVLQRPDREELIRLPVGPDRETALFAGTGEGGSPGFLFAAPEDQPSHYGSRVYFDANPSIDAWIERAEQAGGRVLVRIRRSMR